MKQKRNNGITLIALVITIIVLLILAGVTINMVLGNDGIIAQAQQAKQNQEEAEEKDIIAISTGEAQICRYTDKPMSEEEIIKRIGKTNSEGLDRFSKGNPYKNNVKDIIGDIPIPVGTVILKGEKYENGCFIVDYLGNVYKWCGVTAGWLNNYSYSSSYEGYWLVQQVNDYHREWSYCLYHEPYCSCRGEANWTCSAKYCDGGDCTFESGECDGGELVCLACQGDGVSYQSLPCPTCNDDNYIELDVQSNYCFCHFCRKKIDLNYREEDCEYCVDGVMNCPECNGTGVCITCSGDGVIEECKECGGDYEKDCEFCGGRSGYLYVL